MWIRVMSSGPIPEVGFEPTIDGLKDRCINHYATPFIIFILPNIITKTLSICDTGLKLQFG